MNDNREDLLYILLDNLYFRECRFENKEATQEGRDRFIREQRGRYSLMTAERLRDAIEVNFPSQPSSSKNSHRQL